MDNTKNAGINKELKFDDAVIAKLWASLAMKSKAYTRLKAA